MSGNQEAKRNNKFSLLPMGIMLSQALLTSPSLTHIARLPLFNEIWIQVRDGNPAAQLLFNRHYSKYHYVDGRRHSRFVGPGERIVLITQDGKALFVWRKFIDASGQQGINCSIFRNESEQQSSCLILEAEKHATKKWGMTRFYTYVNPRKIKSNNPGFCFKMAGWKLCGITKERKLLILEKVV